MKVIDKKIKKVKTDFGFHPGKNYKGLESLELRKLTISKKQYLFAIKLLSLSFSVQLSKHICFVLWFENIIKIPPLICYYS